MIRRTLRPRFVAIILFLSFFWFVGSKIILSDPPKEGIVTFVFSLPSLAEQLGPPGEFERYMGEVVQGISFYETNAIFFPKGVVTQAQPLADFRQLDPGRRSRESFPFPILPRSRAYRKKRSTLEASDTHWEEV